MRVGIAGAGATGSSAGYTLAKAGREVSLLEKSDELGGLAGGRVYDPLILALSIGFASVVFPGLHDAPRRAWEWSVREAKAQWRSPRGHGG